MSPSAQSMWTGTDQVEAGETVGGKGRRGNIISSQLILARCTDMSVFLCSNQVNAVNN